MYSLKQLVISGRKRRWILMDLETSLPLLYPLRYHIDHLAFRSLSTQSASLQSVKFFYEFWRQNTEGIARGPQGFVDSVLIDFVVHESSCYEENLTMCCIHRRKFGADNTLRCVFRHVKAVSCEVDFS